MDRFIRYAAYLGNAGLLVTTAVLAANTYGLKQAMLASLLALPAILSLIALYIGPDLEERRLTRQVNKARLRAELEKLSK